MARNEKKHKLGRIIFVPFRRLIGRKAQSTLEYALIFPLLFLMILGILELAFMWHKVYSSETAAAEISANLATKNDYGCSINETNTELIRTRTSFLFERPITLNVEQNDTTITYTSNELYAGEPYIVATIDCSTPYTSSVQLQIVHFLHFFAASLPNFHDNSRIIIIPNHVTLMTSKIITAAHN